MGMKIRTNINSQIIRHHLRQNEEKAQNIFEELSSGKRLQRAANDSARLAISKRLEASTKGMSQAQRNANDGISFIQTAEGGLSEVSNMLIRMRELTVQASSDTVGDNEREMLQLEYGQLIEEIDRISDASKFNQHVTETTNEELEFHIGAFNREEDSVTFDTSEIDASSDTLGVATTGITTKEDAVDSIQYIDEAITNLSGQRATLGAMQSRLQSAVSNLDISILNHSEARSKIEDTDVAAKAAELASNRLINKSAIAALAQANVDPIKANKLIG
jgi:flagellin